MYVTAYDLLFGQVLSLSIFLISNASVLEPLFGFESYFRGNRLPLIIKQWLKIACT